MLPVYPTAFWVCAVGAVLLIGIAKAGFGAPRPTPMEGVDAVGCWWRPGG